MKTEVLNMNFTLMDILKFKEIEAPLFQRPYGWGIKKDKIDLENKPVEYFRDFLCNNNKNLFLGTVFVHSKARYDYTKEDKKDFSVNLSDGQHRLAMSIISLEVVKDILSENKEVLDFSNSAFSRKGIPDLILYIDNILNKSNLKIMKDNLISENLIRLLKKEKTKVSRLIDDNESLTKKINELNELSKKTKDKQEKKEYNNNKKNYQQLIKTNHKKINDMEKESAVYSSYIKVKNYIKNIQADKNIDYEKSLIIVDFIERFNNFKLGLIVLHPDQTNTNEDLDIENEAFLMFNQLNAQAQPLTPTDLFYSFLSKEFNSAELNKSKEELLDFLRFENDSKKSQILEYFGINKKNILDFIMKISSKEKEHYVYVNKLYTDSDVDLEEKIKRINLYFRTIIKFHKKLNTDIEHKLKFLFKFFFDNNNTLPLFIFILKILINEENMDHMIKNDYYKIFKTLVLLSIMTTYIPISGKRPNLARDLNKKNTIEEADIYIKNHFEVDNDERLKELLKEHLIKFEFGVPKHRNLAKLLFVCEIGDSIDDTLKESKNVHYEHIFPKKYNMDKDIPNLEEEFKNKYDDFYLNDEKYIDVLGNATILSAGINKSLSNLSPFEKLEKFKNKEINKNCSINQTHLDFLFSNAKEWSKELILERGEVISDNIISFLFKNISTNDNKNNIIVKNK